MRSIELTTASTVQLSGGLVTTCTRTLAATAPAHANISSWHSSRSKAAR
jgi:hypothetical protein